MKRCYRLWVCALIVSCKQTAPISTLQNDGSQGGSCADVARTLEAPSDAAQTLFTTEASIERACFDNQNALPDLASDAPGTATVQSALSAYAGGADTKEGDDTRVAQAPTQTPGEGEAPREPVAALALNDGAPISCEEPSAADPTGCLALHVHWAGLTRAVNDELNRRPAGAPGRDPTRINGTTINGVNYATLSTADVQRAAMLNFIRGISNMVVDVTVPHCNDRRQCELRAKKAGEPGRWATGDCYPTHEQRERNRLPGVYVCAEGLRCEGARNDGTIFSRATTGKCRVVDQARYDRYFRFPEQPRPQQQQDQAPTPPPAPAPAPVDFCGPFKNAMKTHRDALLAGSKSAVCARGLGIPNFRFDPNNFQDEATSRCSSFISRIQDDLRSFVRRDERVEVDRCAATDAEFRSLRDELVGPYNRLF